MLMGPPWRLGLAAALLAAGAAATVVREDAIELDWDSRKRVSPDVDQSDKKFFKKDYGFDGRPVADHHYVFDHPYPAVQDTGDYDRDFVKDENNDGGRWKAQMAYDVLRSQIRKAEQGLATAKAKLDKEEAEWKTAEERYGVTTGEEGGAAANRQKAEQERDEAVARVNRLEGGSSQKGTKVGGEVGDAVKKVNKEMNDLENCKKELAAAKQRLKELIKEKEELDKKEKADKVVNEKKADDDHKKKVEEKKAKKADKDNKRDAADKEVASKSNTESLWKKKLAQEQKEHAEATEVYEKEKADVSRTEAELKAAEKNLRKFRRPPYVDGNGGVYNNPDEKGSARSSAVVSSVLLALLAAAVQ